MTSIAKNGTSIQRHGETCVYCKDEMTFQGTDRDVGDDGVHLLRSTQVVHKYCQRTTMSSSS